MPFLLMDTSTRALTLGLQEAEAVWGGIYHDIGPFSRDLLLSITRFLAQHGKKPADIQGMLIGAGPGSYTGLRIGFMAAKMLALVYGIPLFGIHTLYVRAWQCLKEHPELAGRAVTLLFRGRRGEVYSGRLRFCSLSVPVAKKQMLVQAPARIFRLKQWPHGACLNSSTVVIGDAVDLLPENSRQFHAIHITHGTLSARSMAEMRQCAWQYRDICAAEPLYLRKSDAELSMEEKKHDD